MKMPRRSLIAVPRIDPRFTPWRLSIRRSRIHHWGVYAGQRIPAGRKVIEYTGERMSRRETKRRLESVDLSYIFELDSYWAVDGAVGGSGAELINHSCDPNLRSSVLRGHILYFSRRVIEPGEELTVDYRFAADDEATPCRCGARACRGTINLK